MAESPRMPVRSGTGRSVLSCIGCSLNSVVGDVDLPKFLAPPAELSRSTWVATSLAPGSKKMSKHTLVGGDGRKLLDLLARLKTRAEQRIAAPVKVAAIHEVGLDGFWIHRLLEANGVESQIVDPASIAVPRRHRRAKTDAIDGETLLRTLMAWQRGEPRVCAMTVPPSPSEEDCRRVSRARDGRCCGSAFSTRTAFEDCCLARGSPTIIRCTRTAGNVWKNCEPETDARSNSRQGGDSSRDRPA